MGCKIFGPDRTGIQSIISMQGRAYEAGEKDHILSLGYRVSPRKGPSLLKLENNSTKWFQKGIQHYETITHTGYLNMLLERRKINSWEKE